MTAPIDVTAVMGELKDFQQRTAAWVFERLFHAVTPSHRFLVADEVGLGKTHVAKGVIAQVLAHLDQLGDDRHDIVYVCSNGAIAAQNLRKLVPKGIRPLDSVRRLTLLPLTDLGAGGANGSRVNLMAITPGTSLSFGRNTGQFEERVLAYAFLRELWGAGAFPARARWIFWEGVGEETGDQRLQSLTRQYRRRISHHVEAFGSELDLIDAHRRHQRRPTVGEDFDTLVDALAWKRSFPSELKDRRRGLVGDVRRALATVGIGLLDPDLVILDEFQRFKDLLDPAGDSWASQLANRLFTHSNAETGRRTRVLLLSATPYRMYTLRDDEGEDHYDDFLRTCSFLMDDVPRVAKLEGQFRALRTALTDSSAITSAGDVCRGIEEELQTVMVRTERLAATPDRGGMLVEHPTGASVEEVDLRAYVRLGDLAEQVGHHDPAEYWKSSPYLFNFMESYQLKRLLETALDQDVLPRSERLAAGPGLLDWNAVDTYKRIDPQNGRLRWLLQDLNDRAAFDVLWIPPSLPYYETTSRYEAARKAGFTKRLVFSGWAVVPKVVSSLLSHEAERRAFAAQSTPYTAEYSNRGGRRLDFRVEGRRPGALTAFLFVWPSPSLAELGDPRPRSPGGQTLDGLLTDVRSDVDAALAPVVLGAPSTGAVDQRWYWAAPLLFDRNGHPEVMDNWFGFDQVERAWTDEVGTGFTRHLKAAWEVVIDEAEPLGRVPEDLADVLAEVAVAGPAVCALRSISAVAGLPATGTAALDAAATMAWGFRSLFNAPEVTALVEAHEAMEMPYWRSAIRHCGLGNLQAVLDEHLHVLRDWLGFLTLADDERRGEAAAAIAAKVSEALAVRTSSLRVDVPHVLRGDLHPEERRMRTRFAVAFGNQRLEGGGEARVEAISTAFNSPFWPFVLTSTSVGQEGLDFHLWCHAVVHWNLPANPVDLEQREGRVHRYKGHAVRRNLAASLGPEVIGESGDPWEAMFALAADRRDGGSEMVPYWIFNDGPARIERWAPVPPYSRDAALLPKLRRSLAAYRLAIGQPRQQELIEYLDTAMTPEELAALADKLRIDLTPGKVGW